MQGDIGLSFISSNKSAIPLTSRSITLSSFLISGIGDGIGVFQALFGGIYIDERLYLDLGKGGGGGGNFLRGTICLLPSDELLAKSYFFVICNNKSSRASRIFKVVLKDNCFLGFDCSFKVVFNLNKFSIGLFCAFCFLSLRISSIIESSLIVKLSPVFLILLLLLSSNNKVFLFFSQPCRGSKSGFINIFPL